MSTKAQTASRIVQNPRLWPSSFSQPLTSQNTCIRIYIFKDGTKVEKFLDFVKKTFPKRKVDIKQQNDGSTLVSLTTTSQLQVNNDSRIKCQSDCYQDCKANGSCSDYLGCVYDCKNGPIV